MLYWSSGMTIGSILEFCSLLTTKIREVTNKSISDGIASAISRSAVLRRRARVTPFERDDFALLDDQSEAPMLQFERLGAKEVVPPAGRLWPDRRRRSLLKIIDRRVIIFAADPVASLTWRRSTRKSRPSRHCRHCAARASIFGRVLGSRARPRSTAATISAGARTLHPARKGAQIAQGLGRFWRGEHEFDQGHTSSFHARERGAARLCASAPRQAATSMSTARSRGLRTRLRNRSQAFSGCCS